MSPCGTGRIEVLMSFCRPACRWTLGNKTKLKAIAEEEQSHVFDNAEGKMKYFKKILQHEKDLEATAEAEDEAHASEDSAKKALVRVCARS